MRSDNDSQRRVKPRRVKAVSSHRTPKILRRQIAATDAEIDRLLYELYDLTEAEIKIVEETISPP